MCVRVWSQWSRVRPQCASETFTAVRSRPEHSRRTLMSGLNVGPLLHRDITECLMFFFVLILLFTFIQACASTVVVPCLCTGLHHSLHCSFFFLSVSFSLVVNTGKLSSIPHPPSDSNRKSWAPVVVLSGTVIPSANTVCNLCYLWVNW